MIYFNTPKSTLPCSVNILKDLRYVIQEVSNSAVILNAGRKPRFVFIAEVCNMFSGFNNRGSKEVFVSTH